MLYDQDFMEDVKEMVIRSRQLVQTSNLLFLASMFFWSFSAVVGQISDDVRLVDQFDPRQGCETMEMGLDMLFAEASGTPSSTAYVVIHQGENAFDNAVVRRKAVQYRNYRRFPADRYSLILTRGSKDIRVELWLGKNATRPQVAASELALKLSDTVSRIQVAEDTLALVKIDGRETYIGTGNPSCLYWFNPYLISELLNANGTFDAELRIKTKSSKRYKRIVGNLKTEFQDAGASIERIKFVYGGRDKELEGGGSDLAFVTTSFIRSSRK